MSIKIAIADDHKLFRKGVRELIELEENFEVILEAGDGQELIDGLAANMPEVILMDLNMPGMNGIKATEYINTHFPDIKILVLSMLEDEKFVVRLMKLGASGYLLKNTDPDELLEAITQVKNAGHYFSDTVAKAMANGLSKRSKPTSNLSDIPEFSDRELQVLNLICKGMTNPTIGESLFISHRTVEGHRKRLLQKADVNNTASLVAYAFRNGLVE